MYVTIESSRGRRALISVASNVVVRTNTPPSDQWAIPELMFGHPQTDVLINHYPVVPTSAAVM